MFGREHKKNGKLNEVDCGKEVILSAGAIASPQILELSGIGRPSVLQQHGIKVQHELEAVGENFRDHLLPRAKWKLKVPKISYNTRAQGIGFVSPKIFCNRKRISKPSLFFFGSLAKNQT